MRAFSVILVLGSLPGSEVEAQVVPFPPAFHTQRVATNGTTLHVRVGGTGPAVVLLHGFGETGDMWGALAAKLVVDHTVIVPDLRGMGLSDRPAAGRERIYLDRFWNEMSVDPRTFTEATRRHHAELYARPGAMHAAMEQFKAFDQDGIDNRAFVARGKLTMPVLALGGEGSFGATQAAALRAVATNVRGAIIPKSGHWIMDENPTATVALVMDFLAH